MKTALTLVALALLTVTVAAAAEPQRPAPVPSPQKTAQVAPAPDGSAETTLGKLFSEHKPSNRTYSCYDDRYQWCQTFCSDLSQTNGCDFFANQQCLCQRYPWADCPVCY
jgi:hypothetical protein